MKNTIIVGSGILGLAVAEFLSRGKGSGSGITVVSSPLHATGSSAAAANLATKGQLFARHERFARKLRAKKIYVDWLQSLIDEIDPDIPLEGWSRVPCLPVIFLQGLGRDTFTSEACRNRHWQRVCQNVEDLRARHILEQSIFLKGTREIDYTNEMWVDGRSLLSLLRELNSQRGVRFVRKIFDKQAFFEAQDAAQNIIFCTGAWTKELLGAELGLSLPQVMQDEERLTVGTTFSSPRLYDYWDAHSIGRDYLERQKANVVLEEKYSACLKLKATFSGTVHRQYISASTLSIEKVPKTKRDLTAYSVRLQQKNEELMKVAFGEDAPFVIERDAFQCTTGVRVGYGTQEIVIEQILFSHPTLRVFVCAGAHKSGFLLAPVIGSLLQERLLG